MSRPRPTDRPSSRPTALAFSALYARLPVRAAGSATRRLLGTFVRCTSRINESCDISPLWPEGAGIERAPGTTRKLQRQSTKAIATVDDQDKLSRAAAIT